MKRKFVIAMGMVSPILLGICAAAILLTGLGGWLLFKPEDQGRGIIKIAPIAPLSTITPTPTPEAVESQVQAADVSPSEPAPVTNPEPAAMSETENPAPAAESAPAPHPQC